MAIIVIDPGHYGGYNTGVCPGYNEGSTMLKLAQYLGAILTEMGADVRYTRTTDEQNPSLAQRGGMVPNADMFISLHTDASTDPQVRGVTAYYSLQRPQTEPFAAEIGTAAAKAMDTPFRGAATWASASNPAVDYMGVLRAAVNANVANPFLIEHGFHTNLEDCKVLSDDAGLRKIAQAEAMVIGQHFNLIKPCVVLYRVQSGESLYSIARKFNVTWQDIAKTNHIAPPYIIQIGQQLRVALPSQSTTECRFVYTVQPGDTLYRIGQAFGVPWQTIAASNNLAPPYSIFPGQQLVISLPNA